MNYPADLKYTEEHEWLRMESDTVAVVGITDFAQDALGELVYVEIETVGESLDQGAEFGTVEAVKTTSELYMPVSGKIIEFNSEIADDGNDNPGIVNEDPYGEGWLIKIEISDPSEVEALLDAETYQAGL